MSNERNGQLFAAGLALAVGLVLAALIATWGVTRLRSADQTIVVTGSARKRITSDLIVWRAGVSYQAPQLSDAYRALTGAVPRVKAYLAGKGVPESQMTVSSISSTTQQGRDRDGQETGQIVGYTLRQTIEIRSTDVDKISRLSREATELINQGILLESMAPEYHYTKLGDLKIQMLAEAARDAKTRAEQIARSVGSRIGAVRAARMGVLQITPADSNEVSDSGMSDTSSREKDITSVVNITFAVE